jgi:hypothetical protein
MLPKFYHAGVIVLWEIEGVGLKNGEHVSGTIGAYHEKVSAVKLF